MSTDQRTPQEIAYDAARLSRAPITAEEQRAIAQAADRILAEHFAPDQPAQPDPWQPIVETLLDAVHMPQAPFNPNTYDYDKCIAIIQGLEAAIGLPPSEDADLDR